MNRRDLFRSALAAAAMAWSPLAIRRTLESVAEPEPTMIFGDWQEMVFVMPSADGGVFIPAEVRDELLHGALPHPNGWLALENPGDRFDPCE